MMTAHSRHCFALLVALLVCASRLPAAEDAAPENSTAEAAVTFENTVKPFLATYCTRCHGAKQQKGDRRFDVLSGKIADDNTLVDFQDILDQLNLGEMPPQDARHPSPAAARMVIGWLTDSIGEYHQTRRDSSGRAVLRRLNAREYRNSVRDLLHLNMTMFDPTERFPRDQTTEHLDNVVEALVTSGYLLARYLEAADQIVEKVLTPREQPAVQKWEFRDGFRQQPEIDQVFRKVNNFEWMTLFDVVGADKHEGAYGPIHAFADGVPFDGTYEIRLKAEAVNRLHPYDPKFLGTDPSEPLRLGIVAGNRRVGALHKPQPVEPLLAELDLADESKWYTVRVWLDAGFTPRFTFRNGLMDVRNLWGRLVKQYPDQFPKPERGGIVENRYNAIKHGKLPQIRIHEIEIEGPFYETWPTASHRAVLGTDCKTVLQTGSMSQGQMERQLAEFASRAYRRPVENAELKRLMQVVAARRRAGRSPLEAYGDALKAVLCSPGFLYLQQPEEGAPWSYALASRLSYFLWSSAPDDTLLQLAARNELQQPEFLKAQVNRMLDDPRSDAFIDGFLGSWLGMRDLGSSPPDRSAFRSFYHYDLDSAMRRETQLFTRHLIDRNLSINTFLDSDFTFVNKPLARHYGLKPPPSDQFEQVTLPDRRRGGLLGQASVLTVTANGIDTSPVVRGVWLLENILGTPPSPPPPDVEPLDPDIRGAKTIRDQLQKHRNVPACNDCHRKIDPMGFALENFDPIGGWRESYGRAKIDASGELPSGQTFRNVEDFKTLLLDRKAQFATALTGKLLAYATGRPMTPSDRPHIDRIVEHGHRHNDGFRTLIHQVVQSDAFLAKQAAAKDGVSRPRR